MNQPGGPDTNTGSEASPQTDHEETGIVATLKLWGAGFFQSCFSGRFYRRAVRRGSGVALGFVLVFAIVISLLQIADLMGTLLPVRKETRAAFEAGTIPDITISNGVMDLNGPDPFVFTHEEQSFLVVLDTTGTYAARDAEMYFQALILTERSFIYRREGGPVEETPLSELHELLGDPIVVDSETAVRWMTLLLLFIGAVLFLAHLFWHTILRLIYLALITLIIWGITRLRRPDIEYGPVFIVGIYATTPAFYLSWALRKLGLRFLGVHTIVLAIVWAFVLVRAVLGHANGKEEEQLAMPDSEDGLA